MSLPIFTTQDKNLTLLQTNWSSQLNPVISQPINQGNLIKELKLVTGSNTINHLLGRKLQGWFATRVRAAATFYDTQDTNQHSDLTLVLVSSANVTIDLFVF